MNARSNRRSAGKQVPLDHLRPGGRHPSAPTGKPTTSAGGTGAEPAEPAEPKTPGGGEGDAVRGKATRSPAEVATRPHLEGSEQSPM